MAPARQGPHEGVVNGAGPRILGRYEIQEEIGRGMMGDASRRIHGTFKSGETRHLEATVDGLIKKDLTLVCGG